jgi:hypothetical protein
MFFPTALAIAVTTRVLPCTSAFVDEIMHNWEHAYAA